MRSRYQLLEWGIYDLIESHQAGAPLPRGQKLPHHTHRGPGDFPV